MKMFYNEILSAFTLSSRIPFPQAEKFSLKYLGFTLPLLGFLVSGFVFSLLSLFSYVNFHFFPAVLLVLFCQYLFFNLFHFDGLLDSADALLCLKDSSRRIDILKDSRIGVFAFFAGSFYLLMKIFLLSFFFENSLIFAAISLYPLIGRLASVSIPFFFKASSSQGLACSLKNLSALALLFGFVLSLGLIYFVHLLTAAPLAILFLSFVFSLVLGICIPGFAYKKAFGGYSGDALGFSVELGELVYLFCIYLLLNL